MSGRNMWKPKSGDLTGGNRRDRGPLGFAQLSAAVATLRWPRCGQRLGVNHMGYFSAFHSIILNNNKN